MLARSDWTVGTAAALPRGRAAFAPARFGVRRPARQLDLTVDLAEDIFSPRWWRGFATLTLLTTATALLAPSFEPLPGGHPRQPSEAEQRHFTAAGVGAATGGSDSGIAMAPTAAVQPLTSAPERPMIDLFARLAPGDNLARLLVRVGATYADAGRVQALVASAVPGGVAPGTTVSITLGRKVGGARGVERVGFRAGLDTQLLIAAGPTGLTVQRQGIAVDSTPLRVRGRVGDGLYWSLRAAGVSAQTAGEYLRALSGQIDVGSQVSPDDRFDLVVANRRAATGESQAGPLLYAGIERSGAPAIQLVKWTIAGTTQWFEASGVGRQTSSMSWPVAAPITSGFGPRRHPILRFLRMHKGIDFGAHWGTPILAAADGHVERAGWAGGYGRQVRLAHAGGIATSYSHMSRMTVVPGTSVRQGQLIGYVGSTGLSTGPHLHYEVLRGGVPVDPMGVRFTSSASLQGPALGAFRARLRELLSVGARG